MNIESVEISSLTPDPANVRLHSPRNLEAIAGSLKRFGQQKPIVVDGNGIVRAGNGTLAAAKSLGWTRIGIVRTALTGAEAIAFAIADNRVGDPEVGSTFDANALAQTLAALNAENVEVPGFTPDELANLIAANNELPADADGIALDESIAEDVKLVKCPHCGKEFPA